jgi:hypothetical protein
MSGGAGTGPFAGVGPRNWARHDEAILDDICQLLTDNPDIDASDIDVEVVDAEVILIGTVDDRDAKRLAEDLAASVPGVGDVQNQLRVEPNRGEQARSEGSGAESRGGNGGATTGQQSRSGNGGASAGTSGQETRTGASTTGR